MSDHFRGVLEYELTASNKDNRAKGHNRLSAHLHSFCHRPPCKLYTHSPLNTFPRKVRDLQPVVSRHMIENIGLPVGVVGEYLIPFIGEIFPLFISAWQDPQASRKKKEATLRGLSQVCAHTGRVVDMLTLYLKPFGVFRKILVTEKVGIEMKRKVLWVFLGALNPYTRKVRLYSS